MKPIDVLLVDDDEDLRRSLGDYLRAGGLKVVTESSYFRAVGVLEKCPVLVVVTDHSMPGPSGTALLETVKARWPLTGRVLFSGSGDKDLERQAIRLSAMLISKLSGSPLEWRRAIIAEVQDAERRHQRPV